MDYPEDFQSDGHIATIDRKNKIIYILNNDSIFIKINVNTGTMEKINCNIPRYQFPGLIYANGNIHVIGSKHITGNPLNMINTKHYIYNEEERAFTEGYDFKEETFPIPIYLNKRKSIMAITDDFPYPLIEYKDNVWQQIKITQEDFPGTTVVTPGQDLMIFLQVRGFWTYNGIFVYNLNNGTIHKSKLYVPETFTATSTITRNDERDEMLTFGFIRKCYKGNNFKAVQDLPFYLIKFISKWICFETVHFIGLKENGKHIHWEIDVDAIINSLL